MRDDFKPLPPPAGVARIRRRREVVTLALWRLGCWQGNFHYRTGAVRLSLCIAPVPKESRRFDIPFLRSREHTSRVYVSFLFHSRDYQQLSLCVTHLVIHLAIYEASLEEHTL